MAHMINVLYITHESNEVLGATLSLLNLLSSVKYEVCPIVVVPRAGKVCKFLEERKVKYYAVRFKLNISPLKCRALKYIPKKVIDAYINYKAIKRLEEIVVNEKIQLIHTNTGIVTIGMDLSKKCGIKHIWHLREYQDSDFGFRPFTGWKKLLKMISESDAVISITKGIAEHFNVQSKENSYILYDAVRSSSEICYIPQKEKYILFLGHITFKKGAEKALKIFIGFHKQYPEYKLIYVGPVTDEYQNKLMALIDENGLNHSVVFLGYQGNVKDYIKKATALLMCSESEAQGRVTVEAMFYGCPVLGFKAGGTQEIIQNGINGYLFSTIDEAIAKLKYIISNRKDDIILNAQEYAEKNFSEEQYGKKLMSIYNYLLNN